MIEPLLVGIAFIAGLLFKRFGMPPLLGYLVAGFNAGGLQLGDPALILSLSALGNILAPFSIGLKPNVRVLLVPPFLSSARFHTLFFAVS